MPWGTLGSTEEIEGASGRLWKLRFERRLAPRDTSSIPNPASSVWLVRDVGPAPNSKSNKPSNKLYAAKRQLLASLAEVDALVDEAAAWRAACLADTTNRHLVELHDVFVVRSDGNEPFSVTFLSEFCGRGLLPRKKPLSEPVLLTIIADLSSIANIMPSPHAHITYDSLLVDTLGRIRLAGFGAHRSAILRDNPGLTSRDDIFDIGLLLYEFVFGRQPPEDDLSVPKDDPRIPYSHTLLELIDMALHHPPPMDLYNAAVNAGAETLAPVVDVDANAVKANGGNGISADGAIAGGDSDGMTTAPEHVARATSRNVDRLVDGIDIAPAFNALLADLEIDPTSVSTCVMKALFKKPMSKEALCAIRAMTMLHNLMLDGPEPVLSAVRKQEKFMSWLESTWTVEAVTEKLNNNDDNNNDNIKASMQCFHGGELSFYAALLRRKATFHQLAAGGFTGRWDRTGVTNPEGRDVLDTRRRKVVAGMADIVEMASELGCLFANAQDVEAPAKHACLGAMVSECCLAFNAAFDLSVQAASTRDAEKLANNIARIYVAARALVFAVERVPTAGGEAWVQQFANEAPPDIVAEVSMRLEGGGGDSEYPKEGWGDNNEGGGDGKKKKKKKKKKKTKTEEENGNDGSEIPEPTAADGALVVHGADADAKEAVTTLFGDLLRIEDEAASNPQQNDNAPAEGVPDMSNAQALASAFGVPEESVADLDVPSYAGGGEQYGDEDEDENGGGGYADYQAERVREVRAPSTGAWAARAGYGAQALVVSDQNTKKCHPVVCQCALCAAEEAAQAAQNNTNTYDANNTTGEKRYEPATNNYDYGDERQDDYAQRDSYQRQQDYARYDSRDSLDDEDDEQWQRRRELHRQQEQQQQQQKQQQQQDYYEDDYDSYESVNYDVDDRETESAPPRQTPPPPASARAAPQPQQSTIPPQAAVTTAFKLDKKRTLIARKLRLGQKISDGENIVVYKGEYSREDVVVKKLTKKGLSDMASVRELNNEVAIMCSLSHENVLNCVAASLSKPDFVLVMDMMKRGSLFEVLYKSRIQLTWAMIKKIAVQLAAGMQHVHERGFVHCDLKSLNVLVDGGYNVKVADFGLAKSVSQVNTINSGSGISGTYQYMAPEVLRGQPHSFQSDVYAFAVVLCEMIAGAAPFHGMDPRLVAQRVVDEDIRPTIPMSCQRPYIEVIQKCWSTVPSMRPTFAQVSDMLKAIK